MRGIWGSGKFQFRGAWAGLILAGRTSFENPVRCTYFLSSSSGGCSRKRDPPHQTEPQVLDVHRWRTHRLAQCRDLHPAGAGSSKSACTVPTHSPTSSGCLKSSCTTRPPKNSKAYCRCTGSGRGRRNPIQSMSKPKR